MCLKKLEKKETVKCIFCRVEEKQNGIRESNSYSNDNSCRNFSNKHIL